MQLFVIIQVVWKQLKLREASKLTVLCDVIKYKHRYTLRNICEYKWPCKNFNSLSAHHYWHSTKWIRLTPAKVLFLRFIFKNSRPQTADFTHSTCSGWDFPPHYTGPDLGSSNFWLFSTLKRTLRGDDFWPQKKSTSCWNRIEMDTIRRIRKNIPQMAWKSRKVRWI